MRITRSRIALGAVLLGAGLGAVLSGGPVTAQGSPAPIPPAEVPNVAPTAQAAAATAAEVAFEDAADGAAAAAAPAPLPGVAADETAADAALNMAIMLDGAGGGISSKEALEALKGAAAAGQPMALWRLGTMYENGDGVQKDPVKAFAYFSEIANDHADAQPKSLEADIVAQSFVKIGEYYSRGLPDAGIPVDPDRARALLLHAATYFGDADAQYRVGVMYLDPKQGNNPLQGARWLSLAAHKGHPGAQARLGDLLFHGAGIQAEPVEGLMWLTIAHEHSLGTLDGGWISDLFDQAMSEASPDQRAKAAKMADTYDQYARR